MKNILFILFLFVGVDEAKSDTILAKSKYYPNNTSSSDSNNLQSAPISTRRNSNRSTRVSTTTTTSHGSTTTTTTTTSTRNGNRTTAPTGDVTSMDLNTDQMQRSYARNPTFNGTSADQRAADKVVNRNLANFNQQNTGETIDIHQCSKTGSYVDYESCRQQIATRLHQNNKK